MIVTIASAVMHLRRPFIVGTGDPEEAEVAQKLAHAEAIVINWLNKSAAGRAVTATWPSVAVPGDVQAATLIMLGELYRFRGDDLSAASPTRDAEDLPPRVRELLRRYTDPVVA